jgi:RNA polymerase sigma-70 factor (ECF subfamily)
MDSILRKKETEAEKSDRELLALVPENKDFFGVLIRRYEKRIMNYLRRVGGGTDEEREDMAQNIFLKAYVYLNSFRQDENFSSWLFGIAHNECIDHWRKGKKHKAVVSLEANTELAAVLKSSENLGEDLERKWDSEAVKRTVGAVPFKYREVLVLRFLEDKSYEEMARILRKPVSTVGTLVRRAKSLFKELMEEKNESR